MDFHVYAVIAIVFLVSFFTLLFISKLPRGKTFDEVLAEKRQLAEKLYGPNYGHKNKPKKVNNKKATKKSKVSKEIKESTEEIESDANSEGNVSENNSPHHKGSHVEFVEAEIIPADGPKKPFTQTTNKANVPSKRKNNKLPGHGILINKFEMTPVNNEQIFEQLNHFEESLPKDVVELKPQKDDVIVPNKDLNEGNKHKTTTKESKKGKTKKDNHDSEAKENEVPLQNGTDVVVEKVTATVSKNHDHQPPKSKKKKQEIDVVQKLIDDREGISVNFLIPLLSKAELTRNEIQILIDFLLNKQQDTTIDHSEWSEGRSDVVQRLKKQLAEKEKALQDEQEALAAIQAKLKELRGEINSEKVQFNAQIKAQADEIHGKKLEIQYINDKFNAEKQTITVQMQQMQAKLLQEKKNNSQEIIQIDQLNNELMSKNTIIRELNDKYQHLKLVNEEKLKKITEYENKFSEYELLLRQKDEQKNYFEQELDNQRKHIKDFQYREQEYSRINVDNERLRTDLRRKDEYQNMQQNEYEKLKQQIVDLSKVQHMDDNNKVEIRNLQNALDSSLKEANKLRIEAGDSKKSIEDLNTQIRELTSSVNNLTAKINEQLKQINELGQVDSKLKETLAEKDAKLAQYEMKFKSTVDKEDELFKQVQEFKDKNNDLRTKNWKLNEALQKAESNVVNYLKISNAEKANKNKVNDTPQADIKKIIEDEQDRIKQQMEKILPELKLNNDDKWLENLGIYIRNKLSENEKCNSNSNSINNNTNNNKYNNNTNNSNNNEENDIDDDSIRTEEVKGVMWENKTLKDKLDLYKKLLNETDSLLKNIQKMSEEKEVYYQGIVENKNLEINQLKSQAT